ncbi:ABC transporter permease [Amycolatopsis sp. H20-H5]|uniref:ABC transporter permease n=1 Tax=Amycolatopsis sp. H20-H5 TaxID=3046309 RepID=UPI002DB560AC|nr:ABC transporter permease subunit [Amycolatopsis sp. H20-H5]MEC3975842.1 ABC transporter permease subunit [Amycolatopsis sp. H20-H5]
MTTAVSARHAGVRRLALTVVAVWVGAPLLPLLIWSFTRTWRYPDLLPQAWTTTVWSDLAATPETVRALLTSAVIAMVVAAFATAAGLAAGRALAWYRVRGRVLIELLVIAPLLIPPFASAMGVQVVFIRAGLADQPVGVVLAHLIPAVPYTTLLLRAAHAGLDPRLEAQARTLGAGPISAIRHTTLPAIRPAVAAAFGFAFLISWSEYLMTVIIGGGSVTTWPMLLFASAAGTGTTAATSALALAGLIPPVALLVVAGALSRRARPV